MRDRAGAVDWSGSRLSSASPGTEEAEEPDAQAHAERGDRNARDDQRAVDAGELERLLAECPGSALLQRKPAPATGSAGRCPAASPAQMPRKIDGMASRMSGTVIVRGDSWILSTTCGIDVALAVERLAHQPEHVEAGHHGDDDADDPDDHRSRS